MKIRTPIYSYGEVVGYFEQESPLSLEQIIQFRWLWLHSLKNAKNKWIVPIFEDEENDC